jgi:hypothetical protein
MSLVSTTRTDHAAYCAQCPWKATGDKARELAHAHAEQHTHDVYIDTITRFTFTHID